MPPLPEALSILEDSIRRSVLADCFESTPALLDCYVKEVEGRLQAAPSELHVLHARAMKLFEWVGQLVQVSREEALESAAHLRTLSGYRGVQDSPPHVRTDA